MRITFVLPDANMGGGTRVIALYAQKLQQRGHRVVVVATPTEVPPLPARVKSWLRGDGWPDTRPIPASHFDFLDEPVDIRRVKRWRPIVDADVPDGDVVIATWWETADWVARLSASKGAKAYFIQAHEVWVAPGREEEVNATWRLPMHKIVVAQWLADLAREQFGDEDVSVTPNAVDLEQFDAPPRGKQAAPTVGLMYSPVEFKGCDISLAAYETARREVTNLRLVAFGSTPPVRELPLPDGTRYELDPPQERIKDIYSACDAWLFGSRVEGFGLPILEAMACRTPVIGTPAGAAPELIGEAGGGILLRGVDPVEMARAILEICRAGEPRWRAMSDAAYATARSYTLDEAATRFEAALVRAIERTGVGVGQA